MDDILFLSMLTIKKSRKLIVIRVGDCCSALVVLSLLYFCCPGLSVVYCV